MGKHDDLYARVDGLYIAFDIQRKFTTSLLQRIVKIEEECADLRKKYALINCISMDVQYGTSEHVYRLQHKIAKIEEKIKSYNSDGICEGDKE